MIYSVEENVFEIISSQINQSYLKLSADDSPGDE